MRSVIGWFIGFLALAFILVSGLWLQNAVVKGRLDHFHMKIELEPVITYAQQQGNDPVMHVRLDAVAMVPLSVWWRQDLAAVKIREAMAFEIRNTPPQRLANLDQADLVRQITWRARAMHGIKLIGLEVSRFSTAG